MGETSTQRDKKPKSLINEIESSERNASNFCIKKKKISVLTFKKMKLLSSNYSCGFLNKIF